MTDVVTSKDIMRATGISNAVTLTRWRKAGLIPPPEVRTHPNGRGKMAYWPSWVRTRCVRIKRLRRARKSLDEIRELLGDDWDAEARLHSRRYLFSRESEHLDVEASINNTQLALERLLSDWVSARRRQLREKRVPLIARKFIDEAIVLLKRGINPVLLVDQHEIRLTADFVVGQHLARFRSLHRPLLVVPLFDELTRHLRDLEVLPAEPTVRPAEKVVVVDEHGEQELRFATVDEWSFEIEMPKRARTRKKRST